MLRGRAGYGLQVQPRIKADKTALVAHRQAQQIAVGNLSMAQQVWPMHLVGIQHAVVVGQKSVCVVRGGLGQTAGDCGQWQGLGVGGLGHDAQAAVLRQRAGGPAVGYLLLQPLGGSGVVHVRRIQQCDQDIDVQQGTHGLNTVGIAQAIDELVADHNAARLKWHKSRGRGGQACGGLRC